jgi:hypothetical protein
MPANSPLGISFSPFAQQPNGASQTGYNPSAPASPQDAIRTLSLRLPRVVGASAPAPQALLNSPGSAAFGAAGNNLDQLMAQLFGPNRRLLPGGGTFNERPPQGDLGLGGLFGMGSGGAASPNATGSGYQPPMPWDTGASGPLPGFTFEKPPTGEGDANVPPPPLRGPNGEPYQPPSAGLLPWEGPSPVERGDRFRY